jgi:hypothetical protein
MLLYREARRRAKQTRQSEEWCPGAMCGNRENSMGYDFQPGESIPLSYNSYQAVFPTPPRCSRQYARLRQLSVVPCFVRGSIPVVRLDAAAPIRKRSLHPGEVVMVERLVFMARLLCEPATAAQSVDTHPKLKIYLARFYLLTSLGIEPRLHTFRQQ